MRKEYQTSYKVSSMDILIYGLMAVSAALSLYSIALTLKNWRK